MRPGLRSAALCAALAAAALCAAWRPLLLKGWIPVDGNMIAISYPNWSMARSAGLLSLPLWGPYRNFGEPVLADPQAMVLYPPLRLLAAFGDFQGFLTF